MKKVIFLFRLNNVDKQFRVVVGTINRSVYIEQLDPDALGDSSWVRSEVAVDVEVVLHAGVRYLVDELHKGRDLRTTGDHAIYDVGLVRS